MQLSEQLNGAAAWLSLLLSAWALYISRKTAASQTRLSTLQEEEILKKKRDVGSVKLDFRVSPNGNSKHFIVTNVGVVDAFDIDFEAEALPVGREIAIPQGTDKPFPVSILTPGSSARILVVPLHATGANIELRWKNQAGVLEKRTQRVIF